MKRFVIVIVIVLACASPAAGVTPDLCISGSPPPAYTCHAANYGWIVKRDSWLYRCGLKLVNGVWRYRWMSYGPRDLLYSLRS